MRVAMSSLENLHMPPFWQYDIFDSISNAIIDKGLANTFVYDRIPEDIEDTELVVDKKRLASFESVLLELESVAYIDVEKLSNGNYLYGSSYYDIYGREISNVKMLQAMLDDIPFSVTVKTLDDECVFEAEVGILDLNASAFLNTGGKEVVSLENAFVDRLLTVLILDEDAFNKKVSKVASLVQSPSNPANGSVIETVKKYYSPSLLFATIDDLAYANAKGFEIEISGDEEAPHRCVSSIHHTAYETVFDDRFLNAVEKELMDRESEDAEVER